MCWHLCGTQLQGSRGKQQVKESGVLTPDSLSVKSPDFVQHPANVGVIATRFEHMIAFPRVSPFQDFDSDAANTPVVHFGPGRTVQIDGVPPSQCPTVIVDLVDLATGEDYEFRTGRPPGPVSSRAPDRSELKSRADGTGIAVRPMITFRVSISGSPHFHELAARQRRLIFRKGAPCATNEENRQRRDCDETNNSELHARRS